MLKLFRLQDSALKPATIHFKKTNNNVLKAKYSPNFTAQCWLSRNEFVAATDLGELLYFKDNEFQVIIEYKTKTGDDGDEDKEVKLRKTWETTEHDEQQEAITAAVTLGSLNGFATGGRVVRIFERNEEAESTTLIKSDIYINTKVINIENPICIALCSEINGLVHDQQRVIGLNASVYEDGLLVATNLNDLILTNIQTSEAQVLLSAISKPSPGFAHRDKLFRNINSQNMNISSLLSSTNSRGNEVITEPKLGEKSFAVAMDLCLLRSIICVAGTDHSIRVLDYAINSPLMVKFFADLPFCVALHPLGHFLAVAFPDKVQLMNIYFDDIVHFHSFDAKHSNLCKFSAGGQYVAMISPQANSILVNKVYTLTSLSSCKGHIAKVMDFHFVMNDRQLASCGLDGKCLLFNILTGERVFSYSLTVGTQIVSIVPLTLEAKHLLLWTNDNQLHALNSSNGHTGVEKVILISEELRISAIAKNDNYSKLIVCGLSPSSLQVLTVFAVKLLLPQHRISLTRLHHYKGLLGPVKSIRFLKDSSKVFVFCMSGSLLIFGESHKKGKKKINSGLLSEYLIESAVLNKKQLELERIETSLEEVNLTQKLELRRDGRKFENKVVDLQSNHVRDITEINQSIQGSSVELEQVLQRQNDERADLERKTREQKLQLQNLFKTKEAEELERKNTLLKIIKNMVSSYEITLAKSQAKNEADLASSLQEFESELSKHLKDKIEFTEDRERLQSRFAVVKKLAEDNAEKEIFDLKKEFLLRIRKQEDLKAKYLKENLEHKKIYNELIGRENDMKLRYSELKKKERSLSEKIKSLEKDKVGHKKEIRERVETIEDKERRIFELRKKNQELEKFRFVLDYKIKELKKQIEPREKEIAELKQQTTEMDDELKQYQKNNFQLDMVITELKLKVKGVEKEITKQEKLLAGELTFATKYKKDLCSGNLRVSSICSKILKQQMLKTLVIEFNKTYFLKGPVIPKESKNDSNKVAAGNFVESQLELFRYRSFLESSIRNVKAKIDKQKEKFATDKFKLLRERSQMQRQIAKIKRGSENCVLNESG
eukprot:augustus_masked-scaffold_11-processed-gene-3.50-mRNA-1 protein AED:0.65 eAED:0.65 QI:0/-1/0/1/-1/1/1/0/1059